VPVVPWNEIAFKRLGIQDDVTDDVIRDIAVELLGRIPVLLVERPGGRIVAIRVQAGMPEPFLAGGFLKAPNHFRSVAHTAILRQHTEPPEPSGFLVSILDIQP